MNNTLKTELGKLSNTELQDVASYIMGLRTLNGGQGLSVGSKVWVVQKTKRTAGVVTKINPKKAIVKINGQLYRVHKAMLELR